MKRYGYLFEQVISPENCKAAIEAMAKSKKKIKRAQRMKENAEELGVKLSEQLSSWTWTPKPYGTKVIGDGITRKQRNIKVPCLWDQCVHHAVMQITSPYIMRRNYYYNCGSIPGAGQIRAARAIKRWMSKKKLVKYGETLDIRKFFESCKAWVVMRSLEHIFKDKKFLALHRKILRSMGDVLAIGFNVSHWYANLVLSFIDNEIKRRQYPDCKYVRYMDDMQLLGNNKRKLHRTREAVARILAYYGLSLKSNWQVYKIVGKCVKRRGVAKRGVKFLSYRFFHGYTLLTKPLMYRISKAFRRAARKRRKMDYHTATSVLSYTGILKHCNSRHFKEKWLYPYVNIKKCKGVIRNEKNRVQLRAAQV